MQIELSWESGKTGATRLEIEAGGTVTLGRGADADVKLKDSWLSRHHCLISRIGNEFIIEDLKSQNGTFVNGKRIRKGVLAHGDRVALGRHTFTFLSGGEAKPAEKQESGQTTSIKMRYEPKTTEILLPGRDAKGKEDTTRLRRNLEAIYRIGNLVSTEHKPPKLFRALLQMILGVIPADRGFLLMLGKNDPPYDIAAYQGPEGYLSFSNTVVNETMKTGLSTLTSDPSSDQRFFGSDSIAMQMLCSIMCVPLEAEDRIIGAIYLDTRNPSHQFTEHDLRLLAAIGSQAGMAIHRTKLVHRLQVLFFDTVRALISTIEAKDHYTKGHSERVAALSVQTAKDLGVAPGGIHTIQLAGLVHDIGKISVPEQVLNKPSDLSKSEVVLVRRHPEEGAKIIRNIRYAENLVPAVLHHHERWDGKGYPGRKAGLDIPLGARIIAVADAFDAMTTVRPYRPPFPREKAIEELHSKAGEQFDPAVVEAFIARLSRGKAETVEESLSDSIAEGIIFKDEEV